jgi:hypothetical protein
MKSCRHFERCSAPICPLDKSKEDKIWYPDEEICRVYTDIQFIKTQKKIAKKARNTDTFYTYDMLNRNIRVTVAIEGINPDNNVSSQIEKWNKSHPEISDEELKALSDRAKAILGKNKKGFIRDKKSKKSSKLNSSNRGA